MRSALVFVIVGVALSACMFCPKAQPPKTSAAPPPPTDWRDAEKETLSHQTQITLADRFLKAGESYFSPDDKRIIFQAIEKPPEGEAADEFYAMFVAEVLRDVVTGSIEGIDTIKRLSPKGSGNTCGWFHPTDSDVVIFASTLSAPTESMPPGYQRASGRYKWMFPPEMKIVRCDLNKADGTAASLQTLVGDGKAYCAEGSLSNDGRHLLYCSLESGDGDLFALDLNSKKKTRIVQAKGYDGGPFFSPDGKRICYRSDRKGDNLLQLFVADLAFNDDGEIVGTQREYQLTDDGNVNWCPFWTQDGRRLVYGTSAMGHQNYEVFMCDADPGNLSGSTGTIKYGTGQRRITFADGADVLPAFSHDGKTMIWTSKRGPDRESQLWVGQVLFDSKPAAKTDQPERTPSDKPNATAALPHKDNWLVVQDPDNGRILVYNLDDHTLSEYDPKTHKLNEVDDQADSERFMELYEAQKKSTSDPQ